MKKYDLKIASLPRNEMCKILYRIKVGTLSFRRRFDKSTNKQCIFVSSKELNNWKPRKAGRPKKLSKKF